MTKWIEATGKSEEAAVQAGLAQLGLDRDSVSVEVLERAKSGLFGIGRAPARVKLTYEVPDEPAEIKAQPKAVPPEAPPAPVQPPKQEAPAPAKPPETPREAPVQAPEAAVSASAPAEGETPEKGGDPEEEIRRFLVGLLQHMEVEAVPVIVPKEEGGFQVTMEGEHLGALIGHRGETLDAIQQLTNYTINRDRAHRIRVHVDAENYRAKREESLRRLARKVAAKVVKYRRNVTLEPMNAYERHVIHETLQDFPDVITYSTGTEPNRRTVVAFSRGKHPY